MKTSTRTRFLSFILCLVMLFTWLPMSAMLAEDSDIVAEGQSYEATWTLDADGVFTVSGGEMADYASADQRPWHEYAAAIKKAVVGNGVTRLGDYAFADCINLTDVDLGTSVTTIGAYTFENTLSLTTVEMPEQVKIFCEGMFHNSGLKKLYVYSRNTEFEGFYYIDTEDDTTLPLDTVVYCYPCSHAHFYFNRETVVLRDDLLFENDSTGSTYPLDVDSPTYVVDLYKASAAGEGEPGEVVLDYDMSLNLNDATRIHNELVDESDKIGNDYYNNGKLELEARISLRQNDGVGELATIYAGAIYSFFEHDLRGYENTGYGSWSCWTNDIFFTVEGDSQNVNLSLNATMKQLYDYVAETTEYDDFHIDEVFVYVSVEGRSYYRGYGGSQYTNETTTVESVGLSMVDAHSRVYEGDVMSSITLDTKYTVKDTPPDYYGLADGELEKFKEPVKREYVWDYTFARFKEYYDEETDENIFLGEPFWNLEGEGIMLEEHDGVLYGGIRGVYNSGSDNGISIRDMLSTKELDFVESLKGVTSSGMGGEARIELNFTLILTYDDGVEVILQGMLADEVTSIVGVCIHSCKICGMCTSEENLACNSRYGNRENECSCDDSEPLVEYSKVEGTNVLDAFTYYGDVTAYVETFEVEEALTTDYFKAVTQNVVPYNILAIFDITVLNEYGEAITINEWGGEDEFVTVSIPLDDETLKAALGGAVELYHVDKNGESQKIEFSVDSEGKALVFTSYRFSPFVLVDSVSYYGRDQLSKLPNSEALIFAYDALVNGIEACESSITVYNNKDCISSEELKMVMDLYRRDYVQHFWIGNDYTMYSDDNTVVYIEPTYIMSGEELERAKIDFEEEVSQILSGLDASMSEYERELYLHDLLADRITYVFGGNEHNAYGAIVEGEAVCDGYAEAFQYLLRRAGIQSFIIIGSSINPSTGRPEGHAWNCVRIDGEYYHTDLTWNDQGNMLFHAYFNQTDAIIREDHAITSVAYTLPTCTSKEAQYFTGKDTYFDEYSAGETGTLLKDNGKIIQVYVPGSMNTFINWFGENIIEIATTAGVKGEFTYVYWTLGREIRIEIIDYENGDVNGDKSVNDSDLELLMKYINFWNVEIDTRAADVNNDGKVNNKDYGLIQRYLNGFDVELV